MEINETSQIQTTSESIGPNGERITSITFRTPQKKEELIVTYQSMKDIFKQEIALEQYFKQEYYFDDDFKELCCVYEDKSSIEPYFNERKITYSTTEAQRDYLSLHYLEKDGTITVCYYSDNNFQNLIKKEIQNFNEQLEAIDRIINQTDTDTSSHYKETSYYDSEGNLIKRIHSDGNT